MLCLSTGCKKLIEVDPPDDWLDSETIFSNDAQATAAVMGLYSTIMGQTKYFFNGGMSLYPGLSADELSRTFNVITEDQFTTNSLLSSNAVINNNIWRAAYTYLYQCNAIIRGLQRSNSVSGAVKNRLTGEARFVRALCYSYLVNLFGDVPLVLKTDAEENAILPRKSVDAIYTQIVTDLQEALNELPDTPENTRPNKMACHALLARVFLYRKEWANAEQAASIVINSANYQLVTNLSQVFKFDSRETVFQLAPVLRLVNSAEGNMFVPVSQDSRPTYVVTNDLLTAFEPGDNRKVLWLGTTSVGSGGSYTYPHKYKIIASETVTEYNIILRLAELYLIRAEARLQQDNIAEAAKDINLIRTRAGLPEILLTISKDECSIALQQEKRIEFFAEWGHRWIDLKRWNKADQVLRAVKVNWQTTAQLYPIPISELERNSHLGQNPGYLN